jgi:hypothetical protein
VQDGRRRRKPGGWKETPNTRTQRWWYDLTGQDNPRAWSEGKLYYGYSVIWPTYWSWFF